MEKRKGSFFDAIPDLAVERIVRLMSDAPRHDYWTAKVPLDVVLALIRCSGTMSRISRPLFSSLCYAAEKPWKFKGLAVIGSHSAISPAMLELLSDLGPSLETLNIADQRSGHCEVLYGTSKSYFGGLCFLELQL